MPSLKYKVPRFARDLLQKTIILPFRSAGIPFCSD
jgi:hypothetical protein